MRVPQGTLTPPLPQGPGEAVPVGVPIMGHLLASRSPMGPPPWQQACFQTVNTRSPPSPWDLGLGVSRKTPFLTFVPDSALSHSHPLPIHSPPVLEAKKFHFGVSLEGSSASLRKERTLTLAAGSAEGQGEVSCWWERMFWKTLCPWMDPVRHSTWFGLQLHY